LGDWSFDLFRDSFGRHEQASMMSSLHADECRRVREVQ
jgi:hypothetical protein